MQEFCVYILYSAKHSKTYCGQTSNLIARFKDHNELGKKGWVKNFRPWKVVHVEVFANRSDAIKREKFLKSGKGRDWITANLLK